MIELKLCPTITPRRKDAIIISRIRGYERDSFATLTMFFKAPKARVLFMALSNLIKEGFRRGCP
jgi:hypothetical protein